MSISDQRTNLRIVTVGDFDPQADQAIEYDFIGRVVAGRYTVLEHIGGGGMADVFRATDEDLGVDVAIKLLKPRMASDELRARMVQEARAAAKVRHANLLRVFGTGKLDGTAYIVMELLRGPNLDQYLREHAEQRLPWNDALALLLPALEALHAIHEQGYIHRDIKAGNILITCEPGRPPIAFVIDLGLVKADRALRTADSPPTTEADRLLCTPGYASPEQAAGLALDRRSDVYSMAVTLYRVLAGRLPFHDARGKAPMVVLAKHVYNEPTMLSEAAVGAEIPPAIATVIESALHKDPKDRPQTMLAFAEALRAAAANTPPPAPAKVPPHRRPHELLLGLGLGIVGTLLAVQQPSPRAPNVGGGEAPVTASRGAEDTALRENPSRTVVQPASTMIGSTAASGPQVAASSTTPGTDLPAATTARTAAAVSEPSMPAPPRTADIASPQPVPGPEPALRIDAASAKRRSTLKAAWNRALARRAPDVQRCADQAAGGLERVAVAVNIDPTGRVFAHVEGAPNNPLSRCLNAALKDTILTAPREPASFVQVFPLQVTSDP
jgi:serine/threonine protein kinase